MNTQSLIVLATLAFTGTAAMADDITMANDKFISTKTRAEVKAEVLKAHAAGVLQFSTEIDGLEESFRQGQSLQQALRHLDQILAQRLQL